MSLSSSIPPVTGSYLRLLQGAEEDLEISDEDSMNMLKERIRVFVDAYPHGPIKTTTSGLDVYIEPLDRSFLRLLSSLVDLPTSPESTRLRDSILPLVRTRRELLDTTRQSAQKALLWLAPSPKGNSLG